MYTTEHNTAAKTMIHTMKAGYIVRVLFPEGIIEIERNGVTKQTLPIEGISLADYERLLSQVEESANEMEEKGL